MHIAHTFKMLALRTDAFCLDFTRKVTNNFPFRQTFFS